MKYLFYMLLPKKVAYVLADTFRFFCGEKMRWVRD